MKRLFRPITDFIEEQGFSLFVTLITSGLIVIITIVSWFWADIYKFVRDTHAFEAIVIVLLIEIVTLLTKKGDTSNSVKIYSEEKDAQARIFEIIEQTTIDRASILSAGLGSRRLLINTLVKTGAKVSVIAQDPQATISKRDSKLTPSIIELIKSDFSNKQLSDLSIYFNNNPSSVRAVILYEKKIAYKSCFCWLVYILWCK